MSSMAYYIEIIETQLDDKLNPINTFSKSPPHIKEIREFLLNDWQKSNPFMYCNKNIKDKIENMTLSVKLDRNGVLYAIIHIQGKPSTRFTQKFRHEIANDLDGQVADGWGECIFGYNNIMTDNNNNKFIIE